MEMEHACESGNDDVLAPASENAASVRLADGLETSRFSGGYPFLVGLGSVTSRHRRTRGKSPNATLQGLRIVRRRGEAAFGACGWTARPTERESKPSFGPAAFRAYRTGEQFARRSHRVSGRNEADRAPAASHAFMQGAAPSERKDGEPDRGGGDASSRAEPANFGPAI